MTADQEKDVKYWAAQDSGFGELFRACLEEIDALRGGADRRPAPAEIVTQKHTPGPWERLKDDPDHGPISLVGDGNQLVCLVYGRDYEEQKSNARLITAAPDLLEALKNLLGNARLFNSPGDSSWVWLEKEVTTAIAKAEGRS